MRSCGTCNACCTLLGVEALAKPTFSPCSHLCSKRGTTKSCTIYAERPEPCGTFKCGWLMGVGGSKDRPDKSGLMLTNSTQTTLHDAFQIQAYRLGSTWSSRAQALLSALAQKAVVVWVEKDRRSVLGGPTEALAQLQHNMKGIAS